MADQPVVNIGENSPEEVAYKLYRLLESADEKNRKMALDFYAECLKTVQNPAQRLKTSPEQADLLADLLDGLNLPALSEDELKQLKALVEKAATVPTGA